MRVIILSVLAAALAANLFAQSDVPAGVQFQQAYRNLQSGDRARDMGNHKLAMEHYRQALSEYVRLSRLYPDWQAGVTRYRVAYCQEQLMLLMDAAVRQARVAPPERVTAPEGGEGVAPSGLAPIPADGSAADRAAALVANGRNSEANLLLLEGLRADPDDVRIRALLGVVRCRQGKFLDAVYVLEPLVEEAPAQAVARVALATAYVGLGRSEQAIEQLQAALRAAPDMADAHYDLAQLLIRAEPPEIDAAAEHYRRSVEAGIPADPQFEERLAEAREKAGFLSRLKFW